jgi:hypothetical protein
VNERKQKKAELPHDIRCVHFKEEAKVIDGDVLVDILFQVLFPDLEVLLSDVSCETRIDIVERKRSSSKRGSLSWI